jgi:beta-glucanase (GH16 family)
VWIEVGMEWTVDGMCWYVDGVKIECQHYYWQTNEGTQSNPATVMLNLAVGGPWAGRYGVDVASFPTKFDIDHVRI